MKRNNYSKIYLYGHRSEIHERFVKNNFTFKKSIQKIEELIKEGKKDNIVLNVDIYTGNQVKNSNYFRLNGILKIAKQFRIKKIQFNLINPSKDKLIDSLDAVASYISKARYVFLFDSIIKVKGLPYCLIPEPEGLILKSNNSKDFVKLEKCKLCTYNQKCNGILRGYLKNLDKSKIKPKLLPREVIIEVTHKCNFKCDFCFNRVSFAKKDRLGKELSGSYIKKIINNLKKEGVPIVRFTGGEPMLRKDIFELIKYAKEKGLQVRLNTNGSLIKNYKQVKEIAKYLDYVLFSMHTCDPKKDGKITGFKNSFEKKIRAIRWFRKAGVKIVNVSTVATMENIKNSGKFYKLFKELKINKWMINRVIPNPGEKIIWGKKEIPFLIEKLIKIRKDIVSNNHSLKVHIINAIPFCVYDPIKINAVCAGAKSVDGHERFVVDPRGFAKPMYYIEKNIGDPLDINACWNHSFMKSLRNYNNVPKECKKCAFLEKCKGGDRYSAYFFNGSYKAEDPLMDFSKIENYIW